MIDLSPNIVSMEASRKKDIVEQAESLSITYSTPPIPVLEIAEQNGIDVVFSDFKDHSKTIAGFVDFKSARMLVNDELSVQKKAFTMAHELGHWVLHRSLFEQSPDDYAIMPRFQKPDLTSPFEVEANLFAGRLLVPAKLLDPVRKNPVGILAEIFMLSISDMEARLLDD